MTSDPPHDTEPPSSAEDTLVDLVPCHDFEPDAIDRILYRALDLKDAS